MSKPEIHPIALTYPPMSPAEMDALAEDVKARGLQRPITLYEGKVLDGRNRLEACERAGVEPVYEEYTGDDPLGHANSLNLTRDLTSAQRAMTAARQWGLDGYASAGRPGKDKLVQTVPISRRDLTAHFRISASTLTQARDLLRDAPDLADEVTACSLSLPAAHEQMAKRRREAAQEAARKAQVAAQIAPYAEAISSGEMTAEEALQALAEEKENRRLDAEARGLWFRAMEAAVEAVVRWGGHADDHLAWLTEPDAPGATDHALGSQAVLDAIHHLRRVYLITLNGDPTHVTTCGPLDSPATEAGTGRLRPALGPRNGEAGTAEPVPSLEENRPGRAGRRRADPG